MDNVTYHEQTNNMEVFLHERENVQSKLKEQWIMEVEISWGSKGGGNNSGSIDISWRGLFNRKWRQLEMQMGKDFFLGVKMQLEPGRRWRGRKGAKKINEFFFLCIDMFFPSFCANYFYLMTNLMFLACLI